MFVFSSIGLVYSLRNGIVEVGRPKKSDLKKKYIYKVSVKKKHPCILLKSVTSCYNPHIWGVVDELLFSKMPF